MTFQITFKYYTEILFLSFVFVLLLHDMLLFIIKKKQKQIST